MRIMAEILLYKTPNKDIKLEVLIENETIWLNQKQLCELFGRDKSVISRHIKNILKENELDENATVAKNATVQKEGNREVVRDVEFYNLDMIISVGYRVNSSKATQFRIWATSILKEYIIKGFAMDDDRLKNGQHFGKDYFKELLEHVRSIRASERRIYQQITDIFAECSIDYDKNSQTTKDFYATVQNKFHFAISGQTSAEIIYKQADARKPFMGLQTWKNSPDGRVLKSDSVIAKNYLSEENIKDLESAISGYFDYIERIIKNHTTFTMESLSSSVNKFLEFNEYRVLENNGNISRTQAQQKAFSEYEEFNKTQKIESDFDREMKKILS
ncbi:MAG: virulence RhuM family protein [Campylobacterota bacterium]|nr:virulence RhuM family protein [Campylobacterota bacterium]